MIVYDKYSFNSSREIDPNGFLRVEMSNITKSQIRPYLGREIPDHEKFNLDPNKIYNVLCPKDELEKAAKTFNNLPLTREHIEVDVDDVPKEKIVGSLGDHATVDGKYLKNNLIIYDKKDIDMVLSGKKKELSCGYRYTPVRESGEYEGQHYDFKMTDIIGNHVALVKQGRAGRDVMVADSSKGILETIKEKIMAVFDKDLVGDEFKESEHPRAKNGQFTNAGGSGSAGKSVFVVKNKNNNTNERKFNSKEEAEKWISGQLEPIYGKERSELKELRDKQYKVEEVDEEEHKDLISGESEKKEESSEKDIIESLKNKFPRKSEKKDGASEYKKERLKDVEAVSGRETEFYKAKEKEVDEDIKEAKEYVSSVIKKDTGEYKHGKDYFKHQVEKTKNSYGEGSDYYKRAKLHLDFYNQITHDSAEQDKVGVVMKEFKEGKLKSGSGEKVTDPKQAIAIALSEADKVTKDKEIPEKQDEPEKAGDKKALVKGEEEMTEEVKNALAEEKVDETKKEEVVEDACGKAKDKDVKACDKSVDKRALIDEIGGILKNKLSEEEWRTVIGKAEELAYNDSETSADDEKKEELKGKEKEAFAEGVDYGEKKEKEEPKKLDSEHESKGAKKADEEEKEKKEEKKEEMAKDSALVMDADALRAEGREQAMAEFKCRDVARKAVKGIVGDIDIFAFDSAEEIYKFACKEAGMNCEEIASYKDAFTGLQAGKAKLAMDASPVSGSNDKECFKDIRLA